MKTAVAGPISVSVFKTAAAKFSMNAFVVLDNAFLLLSRTHGLLTARPLHLLTVGKNEHLYRENVVSPK